MTGPREYFSRLQHVFADTAATHGGPSSFSCEIASSRIRLDFASPALATRLSAALEHRRSAAIGSAHLAVSIWAEEAIPSPPWSWESYMSRGEIGAYPGTPVRIWFDISTGILSMLDLESNRALVWLRDTSRLPIHVVAAPFLMLLQAWLAARNLFLLHAAAVGNAAGALLLAGEGGAGKSSTSLLCLAGGLDFLGDDYCLLEPGPTPTVHSVYCSAKLARDMLQRVPALHGSAQAQTDPAEDKVLLMLNGHLGERIVLRRPIVGLLVPRVTGTADTMIEKIPALASIRALAPSTMRQVAGPDPSAWRAITAVARQVPSYRIDVGYDLDLIPRQIGALLEQLT